MGVVLLVEELFQVRGPHVQLRLLQVVLHAVVEDQPHVVLEGLRGVTACVQGRLGDGLIGWVCGKKGGLIG